MVFWNQTHINEVCVYDMKYAILTILKYMIQWHLTTNCCVTHNYLNPNFLSPQAEILTIKQQLLIPLSPQDLSNV